VLIQLSENSLNAINIGVYTNKKLNKIKIKVYFLYTILLQHYFPVIKAALKKICIVKSAIKIKVT